MKDNDTFIAWYDLLGNLNGAKHSAHLWVFLD